MKKSSKNHEHKIHKAKNKFCFIDHSWKIVSLVLLILLIISTIFLFSNNEQTDELDAQNALQVGNITKDFLITAFNLPELNLKKSIYENNMYLHTFTIQDQNLNIYTSLDGEIVFVPGLDPININDVNATDNKAPEVQKLEPSDKPIVELFIMSYCPYGTQAEKGILPVVDLLGDSIDFEIKFVNYIMHGEVEVKEELLQSCIKSEFTDKYNEYLYCFLEDGNTDRCLKSTGITRDSLSTCIAQTDETYNIMGSYTDKASWLNGTYPKFLIDDADNQKYGIQGSPTFVINGTTVNSARDPQSLLNSICDAFTTKPRACNETLSSDSPTPGFGFNKSTTGSATDATCG